MQQQQQQQQQTGRGSAEQSRHAPGHPLSSSQRAAPNSTEGPNHEGGRPEDAGERLKAAVQEAKKAKGAAVGGADDCTDWIVRVHVRESLPRLFLGSSIRRARNGSVLEREQHAEIQTSQPRQLPRVVWQFCICLHIRGAEKFRFLASTPASRRGSAPPTPVNQARSCRMTRVNAVMRIV